MKETKMCLKLTSKLGVTRGFGYTPKVLLNSFTNFPALNLAQNLIILYTQTLERKSLGVPLLNISAASVEFFATCPLRDPLMSMGNAEVRLKNIIQSLTVHRYYQEFFILSAFDSSDDEGKDICSAGS